MTRTDELPLLTWNLHGLPFTRRWRLRCQRLREAIFRFTPQPQVLLFSELWRWRYWEELQSTLEPDYMPLLVGARQAFFPPGGHAVFLHRTSPWCVRDLTFVRYTSSAPRWRVWEGDGLAGKGVSVLVLDSPRARVAILHTHLQAQYGARTYGQVRALQWEQLTELARWWASSASVVCAVGDFNTRPSEPLFIAQAAHWLDLTADLRQRCQRPSTTIHSDVEWIDYVLLFRDARGASVRAHLMPHPACAPCGAISDHYGLYAHLELVNTIDADAPASGRQQARGPERIPFAGRPR